MRQVDVTANLHASREAVLAALDPAALMRLEGTFDIESVREVDDGWLVTGVTGVGEKTVRKTISVDAIDGGYAYELVDGGFFEELHTTLFVNDAPSDFTVDGYDGPLTTASIRSTYTFGGRFARVKDWLMTSERRRELERAIVQLGTELVDGETNSFGNELENDSAGSTDNTAPVKTGSAER